MPEWGYRWILTSITTNLAKYYIVLSNSVLQVIPLFFFEFKILLHRSPTILSVEAYQKSRLHLFDHLIQEPIYTIVIQEIYTVNVHHKPHLYVKRKSFYLSWRKLSSFHVLIKLKILFYEGKLDIIKKGIYFSESK